MDFVQSIKTVLKKYAEFEGVASRPEYWWWALATFLLGVPLQILQIAESVVTASGDSSTIEVLSIAILIVGGIQLIVGLGLLVPSLAVAVRRLRDAGFHWAFLFLSLIPFLGSIALIVLLAMPSKASEVQAFAAPQPQPQPQPEQPTQSTPPSSPTSPTA